jgi:hypothetical protein
MGRFSNAGNDETIHALGRPAFEKRQGTKSRSWGSAGAAGSMEIWPRRQRGGCPEAFDAIGLA